MEDLVVTSMIVIPSCELSYSAVRASGAGGQNVNKVASKVDLRFDLNRDAMLTESVKRRLRHVAKLDALGRVMVISQTTRDQPRNLEDARQRLVSMIRECLKAPKARRKTKPTRGSQRRRLEGKHRQAEKKNNRRKVDQD